MSKTTKSKKAAEAIEETLDKLGDTIEDMVEDAGEAAKKAATKAKRQVKAAAKKAEPAIEETKKAVRSTRKKVTAALVPEIYVQWDDAETAVSDIVEKAKEDYKAQHDELILSCRVYVKPQDKMAYYVINDVEGKVSL